MAALPGRGRSRDAQSQYKRMMACARGSLPLVSVIVPAYNAQATIVDTLRSISRQQFTDFEVLIVDDGSVDQTRALASKFCAAEPRARLISTSNRGVAAARNCGIQKARGRFIAPIDADDLWHPTYLAKLVAKAAASSPSPVLVFSGFRLIDKLGDAFGSGALVTIDGHAALRMTFANLVGNGSAMIVCRDTALAVGGYDSCLRVAGVEGCEDQLLQMLVAAQGPIASVPEYLVGYRRAPGAMSTDVDRMFRSDQLAMAIALDRCPHLRLSRRARRWRDSRRRLALARRRVERGDLAGALWPTTRALMLDPLGTIATALDRSGRLANRLLRGKLRHVVQRYAFEEVDPTDPAPFGPALGEGWLQRQQRRRMETLRRLDEVALPGNPAALPRIETTPVSAEWDIYPAPAYERSGSMSEAQSAHAI